MVSPIEALLGAGALGILLALAVFALLPLLFVIGVWRIGTNLGYIAYNLKALAMYVHELRPSPGTAGQNRDAIEMPTPSGAGGHRTRGPIAGRQAAHRTGGINRRAMPPFFDEEGQRIAWVVLGALLLMLFVLWITHAHA